MSGAAPAESAAVEVAADYASFERLAAFAEASVGDWDRGDMLRLILVLEELFTNSVDHGYGGECHRPVRLTLARAGRAVLVCYEDEAPPFDPLIAAPAALPAAVDAVPDQVGGLGLWLVRHYVYDYRHERAGGINRTRFAMRPAGATVAG